MGARAFGYCMEVVFHRHAMNLPENSGRLDTVKSGEGGHIGRKLSAVGEVEGSCAEANLVSFLAILWQQKLSHVWIRILIRPTGVCPARHKDWKNCQQLDDTGVMGCSPRGRE